MTKKSFSSDPAKKALAAGRSGIPQLLRLGFAAQSDGRLLQAAELYEAILRFDPLHFDATHMLGVIQYHRGRFDDALRLLAQAVRLQPNVAEALANLDIVQTARRRERELSRGVLPRLAPLVEQFDKLATLAAKSPAVHLIIMQSLTALDEAFLESIVVTGGAARVQLWSDPKASVFRDARTIDLSTQSHPVGGATVFFGTEFSPSGWLDSARPELTLLVVTRDEPSLLLDRIRELSREGTNRVGLLCCGAALAHRLPFASEVIAMHTTPPTTNI